MNQTVKFLFVLSCEHMCLFNFYSIVQVQQLREISKNGMKITEW